MQNQGSKIAEQFLSSEPQRWSGVAVALAEVLRQLFKPLESKQKLLRKLLCCARLAEQKVPASFSTD